MKVLGETALCGAGWQGFAVNPHLYSSVYTTSRVAPGQKSSAPTDNQI